MPDLKPDPAYSLEPIVWDRASAAFRKFFHNYFVYSFALSRGEVDLRFLNDLRPDEVELARSLIRRNLKLRYTHIIQGAADLADHEAVGDLRTMLESEHGLSRKLSIGRALWRLERDDAFPALLSEMVVAESSSLKQAHIEDVLLLEDSRSVGFLVRLLVDTDQFVRHLAITWLNSIEFKKRFLAPSEDLPHDATYYIARRDDPEFVAKLVKNLRTKPREWPVVWPPNFGKPYQG